MPDLIPPIHRLWPEECNFISKRNANQFPDHIPFAAGCFKKVEGESRFKIVMAATDSSHGRFALDF
jgi:hypothetical protein